MYVSKLPEGKGICLNLTNNDFLNLNMTPQNTLVKDFSKKTPSEFYDNFCPKLNFYEKVY